MILLVMARDGMAFMFAWEGMALSAFMLVSTDDQEEDVRRAVGSTWRRATWRHYYCS